MKKYIAITIGPIFDTINLSSSPAALWASSYMFSLLSKTICQELVAHGVKIEDIITPYYDPKDELLNKNDGVGLFHDRVIFNAKDYDISKMREIKECSIKHIAKQIGVNNNYLQKYIMLEAVEFEADNPIMGSSKILDSLELATSYIYEETENPLITLYEGNEGSKNENIKETIVCKSIINKNREGFQLLKNHEELKSLEDIAGVSNDKTGLKKYKYYAIVRADGDKMGEIIKNLNTDEEVRKFSKTCLEYCARISEATKEFGGVTIYAGGDDLLAILPCENDRYETPFEFAQQANEIFIKTITDKFPSYKGVISLSLGITMAFYKYPLYEVLEDSADLLFGKAKSMRNCTAIKLQKHSGQTEGLLIPNVSFEGVINYFNEIREKVLNEDKIFLSVLHKFALFEKAFNNVSNEKECENLIKNVFDGPEHKNNKFITETLPKLYWWVKNGSGIQVVTDEEVRKDCPAITCTYLLRIIKFYFEKGGETDE